MQQSPLPLPPGVLGLPYIGETLAFGQGPFGFLEQRHQRHGPVFKSRLFGRDIVFLAGVEGAEAFYDPDKITRSDAHPFPLVRLFGGVNMEMYDGPKHQALKTMALGAFNAEAIAGYLPAMQALMEGHLDRLSHGQAFPAFVELRRLAIEVICTNVLGLAPGGETLEMTRDYGILLPGLVAIPLALPGSPYGRAIAARDRILARIRGVIAKRRAEPGQDALSRMLGARAGDGRVYTDEEALLEVHHVVMAGFIVFAHMAEILRQLAPPSPLGPRCREEVLAQGPAGPLSLQNLMRMKTSLNVVREAKRHVPLVPLAFGRAKRAFECQGFAIPEGWTVYLSLSALNADPKIYSQPKTFDPDRFERGEHLAHPMAFIPQGAEPATGHRCLGLEYSTVMALAFLAILSRDYTWELPPQDLDYNWRKLPPEPKDGLRVVLRRRS